MSDFVDTMIVRVCTERLMRLNIKLERYFVGIDLGERNELIEEIKKYRYEDRKSRPSGEVQRET